jgi:hypothetical protein
MARTIDLERADAHRPDKNKDGHNLGWPHYDRYGNCLCYCWRCFGSAGCIDRHCAGHNHANCAGRHVCSETACTVSEAPGPRSGNFTYATEADITEALISLAPDRPRYFADVLRTGG